MEHSLEDEKMIARAYCLSSGDCGFELLFGINEATTLTQLAPYGGVDDFLGLHQRDSIY